MPVNGLTLLWLAAAKLQVTGLMDLLKRSGLHDQVTKRLGLAILTGELRKAKSPRNSVCASVWE